MGCRCEGLDWRAKEEGVETYGPMSEGVTGSDGGGGRLMRVGVDIRLDGMMVEGDVGKARLWRNCMDC